MRGTAIDAETGTPLPGVTIAVVGGAGQVATTDDDGRFTLPLPRGTYVLRVRAELYQVRRIRGVVVRGGLTQLDLKLRLDDAAVEEVVIEAEPDRKSEAANLQERKRSAVVQDAVSAQEISRSPDSSAGDAVKRVVSATVVGGRYVFVRGLGGRYSTTLLNGVVLPSPDPDSTAVPLDLFPASLIANLTVVKSYTPDLPGAFAGGDLVIKTNTYPQDFEVKAKVSLSGDSVSTGNDRLDYAGGGTDFLAFDDGGRALPSLVPTDRPLRVGTNGVDAATAERVGETFQNVWNTSARSVLPNLGLGAQVGDSFADRCERKYGYLATFNYGYKQGIQDGEVAALRISEGALGVRQRLASRIGTATASLGGLLNAGVELTPDHAIDLLTLYTRTADDRTQEVSGFSEADDGEVLARRMQFVTRAMSFTQLTGRHTLPSLRRSTLDWEANVAVIDRDEPDTRDIEYDLLDDGRRRFQNGPGSAEHFFSHLDDTTGGGGVTATVPLGPVELRVGGLAQWSKRHFAARRFRFGLLGSADPSVVFLDPEQMLSAEHIGPDFRIEERTLQADTYDASTSQLAGFAMADVTRFEPLRIVGGLRYETGTLALTPGSPYAITQQPEPGIDRADSHVMPAVNVIYAVSDRMNLRAGYSFTVARPQLRELAPFLFFDFARRRAVSGNVDLVDTRIHNGDLRWEWFPAERSVLAASAFVKQFRDPIESVIVNVAQGDLSFANAAGASLKGVELEARGSLDLLHPSLAAFRATGNLTLIDSQIELGPEAAAQTNQRRPLQGQSSYVVNLDLGWERKATGTDVSLLYNVFGERIAEVGVEGLPDVYEQPFHRLDLSASQALPQHLKLKFAATNLLNQDVVVQQGEFAVQKYRPGVAVSAALEWSP
ncbi:MAG: TonB-dependent receptor [Myxococcales bacterium]|nr:TonB-dependent receptor [Myxococcales bacterium]